MYRDHRVIAIVPARGGSKGIPLKNIVPLAGKELIRYTTEFSSSLIWLDSCVVSTDHPKIASIAQEADGVGIIWRPAFLSGDRVSDADVVLHAVEQVETETRENFDIVLMLQPTSPLRTAAHLLKCIDELIDGDWDSVWTLSETPLSFHPLKQLLLDQDGKMKFFVESGNSIVARQELNPVFHRNGICYAMKRNFLGSRDSLFSEGSTAGVIIEEPHVSIDDLDDLAKVESLMRLRPSESPSTES